MNWHADAQILEHYGRGELPMAQAASLEAHLLACGRCREALVPQVDARRLAGAWTTIEAALDPPRLGPVEWLLRRLGVSDYMARLLASTPSLRTSWILAVVLALAFAAAAAHAGTGERAVLAFLVVAPLLPLAGVAAAFAPGVDPAAEVALAAPMRTFGLLLVRAAAVLVATLILIALAALTLPGPGWTAGAWLVPSLALVTTTLALSTYVSPLTAAGAIAGVWVTGVITSEVVAAGGLAGLAAGGPIGSAAFHTAGQVALCIVSIVAGVVMVNRRDIFEVGRTS